MPINETRMTNNIAKGCLSELNRILDRKKMIIRIKNNNPYCFPESLPQY